MGDWKIHGTDHLPRITRIETAEISAEAYGTITDALQRIAEALAPIAPRIPQGSHLELHAALQKTGNKFICTEFGFERKN